MRLLPILSLVVAGVCASNAKPKAGRYLKLPVVHSKNHDVLGDPNSKRADTATISLANRSDIAYYAQLDIGNPPQPQYVQLDTGSFELWVNPNCSNLVTVMDRKFCESVGRYNPDASSTSVKLDGSKTLVYGIGRAKIGYVTDDIALSGTDTQLKGVQFGVATSTEDEFSGILGIGHGVGIDFPGIGYGESTVQRYPNFIDELQEQGVTDTKAFSLALGGKMEQEGVVIFGGLDTGKFSGTLRSLPIVPPEESPDGIPRYWVDMDHISHTEPGGQTKRYENTSMTVFLDSGATLTLFPPDLANKIAADFGAKSVDFTGMYPVDCALNNKPGTLDFAFDGITIRVPYNELIREFRTILGELCYLGIGPHESFVLLGDSMLRSAYAVFDQTNEAIHLAQYVNCGSNDAEITAETDLGSIEGDCDPPDFEHPISTDSSSDPSESDNESRSTPRISRANSLLGLWIVFVVIWCI